MKLLNIIKPNSFVSLSTIIFLYSKILSLYYLVLLFYRCSNIKLQNACFLKNKKFFSFNSFLIIRINDHCFFNIVFFIFNSPYNF